jgi:C-terminal processing protease CtpA/Prc
MRRLATIGLLVLIAGSIRAQRPNAWLGFGYAIHNFGAEAPVRQWLYVEKIAPAGPAMKGGLQVQDAIVAINGVPVHFASAKSALDYFRAVKPGTLLRFHVIRRDKRMMVSVRAQPIPADYAGQWPRNESLATREDAAKHAP